MPLLVGVTDTSGLHLNVTFRRRGHGNVLDGNRSARGLINRCLHHLDIFHKRLRAGSPSNAMIMSINPTQIHLRWPRCRSVVPSTATSSICNAIPYVIAILSTPSMVHVVFPSLGVNAIRTSISGTSARVNFGPIGS